MTEDAPCLVCGEPKPDDKPCLNADCAEFGGAVRYFDLGVTVTAERLEDLPSPDAVRNALIDALPDDFTSLVMGDPWVLADIGLKAGGAFTEREGPFEW